MSRVYKPKKQSMRQRKLAVQKYVMSTSFRFGLLIASIATMIAYVVQLSLVSTTGFDISSLERQVQELERENQRIELQIAKFRSMKSIQERLVRLGMVEGDAADYLVVGDTHVAQR